MAKFITAPKMDISSLIVESLIKATVLLSSSEAAGTAFVALT